MSNNLGQIYATSKHAEKYIILDSQNVEVSGNLIVNNNVGINTSTPTQKLDINGNLKINNEIYGTNDTIELYTNTDAHNSYSWMEMRLQQIVIAAPKIYFRTNSTNAGYGDIRMTLLENGNVGIGTLSPTQKLEVNGSFSCNSDVRINNGFINHQFGSSHWVLSHENHISNASTHFGLFLHDNNGPTILNCPTNSHTTLANGNTYKLYVYSDKIHHNVRLDGPSDDRLKWQETPITDGLDVIMLLNPMSYWKGKIIDVEPTQEERRWEIGLIAQEVEKIPQLKHCVGYHEDTHEPEKSYYTLSYADIHNYHLAATQELYKKLQETTLITQQTINELNSKVEIIERHETLIQSLISRIEVLESRP